MPEQSQALKLDGYTVSILPRPGWGFSKAFMSSLLIQISVVENYSHEIMNKSLQVTQNSSMVNRPRQQSATRKFYSQARLSRALSRTVRIVARFLGSVIPSEGHHFDSLSKVKNYAAGIWTSTSVRTPVLKLVARPSPLATKVSSGIEARSTTSMVKTSEAKDSCIQRQVVSVIGEGLHDDRTS